MDVEESEENGHKTYSYRFDGWFTILCIAGAFGFMTLYMPHRNFRHNFQHGFDSLEGPGFFADLGLNTDSASSSHNSKGGRILGHRCELQPSDINSRTKLQLQNDAKKVESLLFPYPKNVIHAEVPDIGQLHDQAMNVLANRYFTFSVSEVSITALHGDEYRLHTSIISLCENSKYIRDSDGSYDSSSSSSSSSGQSGQSGQSENNADPQTQSTSTFSGISTSVRIRLPTDPDFLNTDTDTDSDTSMSMHQLCHTRGKEAYQLTITSSTAVEIHACSVTAAQLAVGSTLSQLYSGAEAAAFTVPAFPYVIRDYPKYSWRGLMVDLARHFIPLPLIKRTVDGMALSKLNVLHLHLTDAQSFPVQLEDKPGLNLSQLAKLGSFGNNQDKVYSKQGLRELVTYAAQRGIEVVPELDVPAHAYSWGKAFPDIVVPCTITANRSENKINAYSLDPSNPRTYEVIEAAIRQLVDIFPSEYFHVGGDEVIYGCWRESPKLVKWAKELGLDTMDKVYLYFEQRVFSIVRKMGKRPLTWQGVIDSDALPSHSKSKSKYPPKNSTSTTASTFTSTSTSGTTVSIHSHSNSGSTGIGGSTFTGKGKRGLAYDSDKDKYPSPYFDSSNPSGPSDGKETGPSGSDTDTSSSETGTDTGTDTDTDTDTDTSSSDTSEDWKGTDTGKPSIVQPWKCWGGLSIRAAHKAQDGGNPVLMSACWYLDFNNDWTSYFSVDQAGTSDLQALQAKEKDIEKEKEKEKGKNKGSATDVSDASDEESTSSDSSDSGDGGNGVGKTIGGEGASWHEHVDHVNYECRVWPRAGAIAARLWGFDNDHRIISNEADKESLLLGQAITLSIEQSKLLTLSMHHYRHVLAAFGIRAADVRFHQFPKNINSKSYDYSANYNIGDSIMVPYEATMSEWEGYRYVNKQLLKPLVLSSDSRKQPKAEKGTVRATCECLPYPKDTDIQRPLQLQSLAVAQLNIADGTLGPATNPNAITKWMLKMANKGTAIVGLCELNGWDALKSQTDIMKNREIGHYHAAAGGFPFFHVKPNLDLDLDVDVVGAHGNTLPQPYLLGLSSIFPFIVINEFGPPNFQRGAIHAYFHQFQLHVWVVHLHAHSSTAREKEAILLASLVQPLLANNSKVIVMGDMNTLSPLDSQEHNELNLVKNLQRTSDPWPRLALKFLDTEKKEVNYKPMQSLLDTGLVDSCVTACFTKTYGLSTYKDPFALKSVRWSSVRISLWTCYALYEYEWLTILSQKGMGYISGTSFKTVHDNKDNKDNKGYKDNKDYKDYKDNKDPFSVCMAKTCLATEPTKYSTEWPKLPNGELHPQVRLDFILVSPAVLDEAHAAKTSAKSSTNSNTNSNTNSSTNKHGQLRTQQQRRDQSLFGNGVQGKEQDTSSDHGSKYGLAGGGRGVIEAYVDADEDTVMMSDHFPVYVEWEVPVPYDLY